MRERMAFHLAELNVARLLYPLDHPAVAEFAAGIERINRLAEESPGFVWRWPDGPHPWSGDPLVLVNMSVWESPEALKGYVYHTDHLAFYRKRAEWFEKPEQAHYVLWWMPAGRLPTVEEAHAKLEHFRRHGATPEAFWFGKLFPADAVAAMM